MKKIISLLILSTLLICTPVNAKTYKKNWCSGLRVAKFGIYNLGCHLGDEKSYYPLRGKNWIYSGDTFGFEVDNVLKKHSVRYNIKISISTIKGKAEKLKPNYDLTENGTFNHRALSYKTTVDGTDDFWSIWDGKIYVKSKKGCTIQIKFSQKWTTSKTWSSYTIKIKVKKKP